MNVSAKDLGTGREQKVVAGAAETEAQPAAPPSPTADTDALLATARECERDKDFAGARSAYAAAAAAGELRAAFYLGRLHRRQDNFAQALAAYQQALDATNALLAAWAAYDVGEMMERRRRFEEAADYYRRAAEFGDADPGPRAAKQLADLKLSGRVR